MEKLYLDMQRRDLRKVKLSKYPDGSGEFVDNGYFHKWAEVAYETNDKTFPVTVALIEMEDGKMKTFPAHRLRFVSSFSDVPHQD